MRIDVGQVLDARPARVVDRYSDDFVVRFAAVDHAHDRYRTRTHEDARRKRIRGEEDDIERELLLATVSTTGKGSRSEIMELVQVFNGRIVDVGHDAVTVMLTSSPETIDGFEDLLRPYGITSLARTGRVALARLEKQAPDAQVLKTKKAG